MRLASDLHLLPCSKMCEISPTRTHLRLHDIELRHMSNFTLDSYFILKMKTADSPKRQQCIPHVYDAVTEE
jgi:hypothetical protein